MTKQELIEKLTGLSNAQQVTALSKKCADERLYHEGMNVAFLLARNFVEQLDEPRECDAVLFQLPHQKATTLLVCSLCNHTLGLHQTGGFEPSNYCGNCGAKINRGVK